MFPLSSPLPHVSLPYRSLYVSFPADCRSCCAICRRCYDRSPPALALSECQRLPFRLVGPRKGPDCDGCDILHTRESDPIRHSVLAWAWYGCVDRFRAGPAVCNLNCVMFSLSSRGPEFVAALRCWLSFRGKDGITTPYFMRKISVHSPQN